ncbi:hypothetical protein HNQ94_003381 [Salirhabdus euzebyi]|uniref:DUF3048 domain-containing protein n=1 Tax=Salirhabdus euzebyi TaxID=394506 RepID=A0A841Q9H1_9BACI|nr:DUF3048 domain-containing protein [Salirhabdus euzebyi]MBB6454892.1 hypothetical protein [Salirhabdus euzebyi]
MNKAKWLPLMLILMMIVLAACKDEEASNDTEEKNQPEPVEEPVEVPEEPEPKNTYPLTGIKTDDPVNNRIVGVMVNNHSAARPQSGLSQADIVYEILAEGAITRFVAFFQSETPEVVGPVRSAREYYADIAQGMDAIYVYHGAATHIEQLIINKGVDLLSGAIYDNDQFLFKREDFRVAPHNSYLIYPNLYEVAEGKGLAVEKEHEPLPFLTEEEVTQVDGEPATKVHLVYREDVEEVTYEYDETKGQYIRFSDGEKTVELESEEPILLDNIFIVETGHEVIDSSHRRAIDLTSGGKGYLIRKGIVEEVEWKNVDGKILPFKDGQPAKLVPGKTWVNIMPTSPGISESVQFNEGQ